MKERDTYLVILAVLAAIAFALSAAIVSARGQGLGMGLGIDDAKQKVGTGSAVTTCIQGAAKFNGACNAALAGMMG